MMVYFVVATNVMMVFVVVATNVMMVFVVVATNVMMMVKLPTILSIINITYVSLYVRIMIKIIFKKKAAVVTVTRHPFIQ